MANLVTAESKKVTKRSRAKSPIKWEGQVRRLSNSTYKLSGRGKKENFKKKKDVIFQKNDTLARESGAHIVQFIYQEHLKRYHLYSSNEDAEGILPFDLEKFVRNVLRDMHRLLTIYSYRRTMSFEQCSTFQVLFGVSAEDPKPTQSQSQSQKFRNSYLKQRSLMKILT